MNEINMNMNVLHQVVSVLAKTEIGDRVGFENLNGCLTLIVTGKGKVLSQFVHIGLPFPDIKLDENFKPFWLKTKEILKILSKAKKKGGEITMSLKDDGFVKCSSKGLDFRMEESNTYVLGFEESLITLEKEINSTNTFTLRQGSRTLDILISHASTDDSRKNITSIKFEVDDQNAVSTDGHRLVKLKLPVSGNKDFFLSVDGAVALKALVGTETAQISYALDNGEDKDLLYLSTGRYVIVTSANSHLNYPDYNLVLGELPSSNELEIDKNTFLEGIDLVSVFSSAHTNEICIKNQESQICLYAHDGTKEGTVRVGDCGNGRVVSDIKVNRKFLVNTLKSVQGDTVWLGWEDCSRPLHIKSGRHDDDLYIVMPMRY
jgi:DNA polymerase III sliding clamp (beta) subunit (PCNA family)